MSATLVHRNPNLIDGLTPGSSGVSEVGLTMALSICHPAVVEGVSSRHGSAVNRARISSAKSMPNYPHYKMLNYDNQVSPSVSASTIVPYPPSAVPPDSKQGLTLPKLQSQGQKCYSNSQASITMIDTVGANDPGSLNTLEKPNPSSIFPNFRALQRLAANAKAITAMWNQDSSTFASTPEYFTSSNITSVVKATNGTGDDWDNRIVQSSWSSHDEISVQHASTGDGNSPKDYKRYKHKTKRLARSWSRRRKSPSKKQKTPSPTMRKDNDVLGNFSLASTMTLNNRWENKKVETYSTKYNKKFTSKPKSKSEIGNILNSSTNVTLTTVALDKRDSPLNQGQNRKKNKSESADMPTSRTVLEQAATVYGRYVHVNLRLNNTKKSETEQLKKVYLSERQSGLLKDCGKLLPCAPPASPTPEQLKKYEYVPSLNDLRSQRAVKDRLSAMKVEEKKERQKQKAEKVKQEKQMQRSHLSVLRQRQRQEIYALNKMMTENENDQFQKFCKLMSEKGT